MQKRKALVQGNVGRPYRRAKRQFGYAKVSYLGMIMNILRSALLLALPNLLVANRNTNG